MLVRGLNQSKMVQNENKGGDGATSPEVKKMTVLMANSSEKKGVSGWWRCGTLPWRCMAA